MPFKIIRNDITKVRADVIVNTANPLPVIGTGMDSAVYHAAGEMELISERMKIGAIARGQAAATPAFNLLAKYIIHTVGPKWIDGNHGEREILHSCYENSLLLAVRLKAKSIAFPLIATGNYGFPKDEALSIALNEIGKFLLKYDMEVSLVVFDIESFELSAQRVGQIDEYIKEHDVRRIQKAEYGDTRRVYYRQSYRIENKTLDNMLSSSDKTFQQRLFELIDASGMDEVTVYKKANIDRKLFSRIRCNKDYRPNKKTAVALAIALKLDMPTMLDLLSRAEIAFSPCSKFDIIIRYFVEKRMYDILEINAALFKYGQPMLGA